MPEIVESQSVVEIPRPPIIHWGAIVGGFFFVVAASWLMLLLGAAIGTSVADASDAEAIGQGFGIGAIIWMLLSAWIAYFVGALLAARLANRADPTAGMLQGLTLWSLSSVAMLVLGSWGVGTAVGAGSALVASTARAAANVMGTTAEGIGSVANEMAELGDTEMVNEVQAQLKRSASQFIANSQGTAARSEVSGREVSAAIERVDQKTLGRVAAALVKDDSDAAKEVLSQETDLSTGQIDSLIIGVDRRLQKSAQELREESEIVRSLESELNARSDAVLEGASRIAGPKVDSRELERAIRDLDRETLREAATELILGRPDSAKNVLAANTSLDDRQIDAIVNGVVRETEQQIDAVRQEADDAIEAASDYAQAVVWTSVVAGVLALCASLLGGLLGAQSVDRLVAVHASREVRNA